ncbi:MAG: NAD(P)-dependent alcohol dehydrogenase [Betaproteobacteria bacterium]
MQAVAFHAFGGNDVIEIADVPKPSPKPREVLIKVHAAGVNPVDWKTREGQTRIFIGSTFPKILGIECAGEVVDAGNRVTKYKPGDTVIATAGPHLGAYAEYVAISEKTVFPMPKNISFEEAAAIPIAGMTAFIALRDKGRIAAGRKVVINGASGGVGTFAVQIAKLYGAQVTAVCSSANAGLVKELGADSVIDYHQQDFTKAGIQYDIVFDAISARSFKECKQALTPHGIYINTVPSPSLIWSIFVRALLPGKKAATIMVGHKSSDVEWLCGHIQAGKIKVVLDKVFPLDQVKEALAYSQTGRVRGKVALKVV